MTVHAWPDFVGFLLVAGPTLLLLIAGVWALSGAVALAHRRGMAAGSAAPGWSWPRQVGALAHGHAGVVRTCSVCRLATQMDDVVAAMSGDRCVCLRCYARETGTERPMPAALQKALRAALTDATTA